MRAIVTGGNGFIGSHVVDLLHENGFEVGIIDLVAPDTDWAGGARAKQFRLDVAASETTEVIADFAPQYVFHLAALASVPESIKHPVIDANTTIVGLLRVLEGARQASTRKIIYSSSASIYGDSEAALPLDEAITLLPKSPYAVAKMAGEYYLSVYERLYGLRYAALRYANVYGPRQGLAGEGGVVAIFGKALVSGTPLHLNGDGGHTRDYIFVKDIARANWLAATSETSGACNISTGLQTSNRELIKALERAAGKKAEVITEPDRIGDIRYNALSPLLAKALFSFQPSVSLAEGLDATIVWMRESGRFG